MNESKFEKLLTEALSPEIAESELTVYKKENLQTMKRISKRKIVIVAMIACLAIGTTCFAAGKITGLVSGFHNYEVTDYTKLDKIQQDAGFEILSIPEAFENGYAFKNASVQDWKATDDSCNVLDHFNGIYVYYTKDDSTLMFTAEQEKSYITGESDPAPFETQTISDIEVNAYRYLYKSVPVDYELTEADEAFLSVPGNEISVGSDEVEITPMSVISFTYNGIYYSIMDTSDDTHISEMFEMAEEILAN